MVRKRPPGKRRTFILRTPIGRAREEVVAGGKRGTFRRGRYGHYSGETF